MFDHGKWPSSWRTIDTSAQQVLKELLVYTSANELVERRMREETYFDHAYDIHYFQIQRSRQAMYILLRRSIETTYSL